MLPQIISRNELGLGLYYDGVIKIYRFAILNCLRKVFSYVFIGSRSISNKYIGNGLTGFC